MNNHMLLKFGRREHLEALKQGCVYFNVIENYRIEPNTFRGDLLEGKLLLDPQKFDMFLESGESVFSFGIPRPNIVQYGYDGDESLHMFCAVAITTELLESIGDNKYIFKESFKKEALKFGDYVAVFFEKDLISRIDNLVKSRKQGIEHYAAQMINYKYKQDYSDGILEDPLDIYFTKDIEYKNQNEWRLIVSGNFKENTQNPIVLNCESFQNMNIYSAKDFLNIFIKLSE